MYSLKLSNPFGIEFTDRGLFGIETSMDMNYVIVDENDDVSTVASKVDLGEISPLRNFSLQYPKYVLSLDGSGTTEYKIIDYTPIDDTTTGLTIVGLHPVKTELAKSIINSPLCSKLSSYHPAPR